MRAGEKGPGGGHQVSGGEEGPRRERGAGEEEGGWEVRGGGPKRSEKGPVDRIAAGRPGKGTNKSKPNVNGVTRRVRFCFWCSAQKKHTFTQDVSKKNRELSRPSLSRPKEKFTAGSVRTLAVRGVISPGVAGSCLMGFGGECGKKAREPGEGAWERRKGTGP